MPRTLMPHLCPTSWSAAFLTFWVILFLLNSLLWWVQAPKFPSLPLLSQPFSGPLWLWV